MRMPKQTSSYQDMDGAMLVTVLIGGGRHLSINVVKQPVDRWLPLQSRQSVVRARTTDYPIITFTVAGEGGASLKTKMRHHRSIQLYSCIIIHCLNTRLHISLFCCWKTASN